MKFPFVRPEIPPLTEWQDLLQIPYARRYFTNFGDLETQLSEKLLERFGAPDAAVTLANNATSGLTAAVIAHEVRGNVVIPNFTFPATLDGVLAARCTPVLCDISPSSLEMCPRALERICEQFEVAAVMPVRSYGFVRDFSPIVEVARSIGVPTIIDGAAALGGSRVEVAPDVTEVLSLHATKSLGIGEGGAIFSHESRGSAVRSALNFGLQPDRRFGYGINGKMTEVQAAIGLAQVPHAERMIAGRRAMADWYSNILRRYNEILLPTNPGPTAWSNYPILLPVGSDAEAFQQECHSREYQVRRYYWPTLAQGFAEELLHGDALRVSTEIAERAVCLPLYVSAGAEELAEIERILTECLDLVMQPERNHQSACR
jgi:dTDP-4-amino-4,6-dideoxygalactose transaminase